MKADYRLSDVSRSAIIEMCEEFQKNVLLEYDRQWREENHD